MNPASKTMSISVFVGQKSKKLDKATSLFRPSSRDNGSSRRRPCGVDPAERKDSLERLIDYRNTCAKLECPKKSTDNQLLMRRNKLPWMFCLSRVKLSFQLVICLSKRQQYYCKVKWGSRVQNELQGISHLQKLNALLKHALRMKTYDDGLIERNWLEAGGGTRNLSHRNTKINYK